MSGGEVRKVSREDIQLVQNLIEHCLQLYMNRKEVVETLSSQAKIEPSFTELVWQKLEEENREFFNAYYVRMMLKNQIVIFNKLLADQCRLMHKDQAPGVNSGPPPNGPCSALDQAAYYLREPATTSPLTEGMICYGGPGNGVGSSGQQFNYAGKDVSGLTGNMDLSTSMLSALNSTTGRFNGANGATVKAEPMYSNNSEFLFCMDNTAFLEPCSSMEDAAGGSFGSSELTGHQLHDPPFDIESISQMPRNFSFSDLADDYNLSTNILEMYGRSPFLHSNFPNSLEGEHEDRGDTRLDGISEGGNFDDFGSE